MGLTFTFPSPVTAAGVVWTDSDNGTPSAQQVTLEAFGPGMTPLGTPYVVGGLGDGSTFSNTADDVFLGVQDLSGIAAIRITQSAPSQMEVDHLQFGDAPGGALFVPEPSAVALAVLGWAGLLVLARRRRR